jgi:PAS domain S-box-containing protein
VSALDFEALVNHLSTAVVVVNLDGRVVFTNRSAERLLGLPKEKLAGSSFQVLAAVELDQLLNDPLAISGKHELPLAKVPRGDGSEILVGINIRRFGQAFTIAELRPFAPRLQ